MKTKPNLDRKIIAGVKEEYKVQNVEHDLNYMINDVYDEIRPPAYDPKKVKKLKGSQGKSI